jgi:hypothetical protein
MNYRPTFDKDKFEVVWTDHYHFDLLKNGLPHLVDCDSSFLGLVMAYFPETTANERPGATFWTWFKMAFL